MATDKLFFLMDPSTEEHHQSEYLNLRMTRQGPRRSGASWQFWEHKPVSRVGVALREALERDEEQQSYYPALVLRHEMTRLVEAFMAAPYVRQVATLQENVRQVQQQMNEVWRNLNECRSVVFGTMPLEVPAPVVVNWSDVEKSLAVVIGEMGWTGEWHIDQDTTTVFARVAGVDAQTLARQKFDFYQKMASRLDDETFRAVTFDLEPSK